MHPGRMAAKLILDRLANEDNARQDGRYYPRTSAVSRCPRDAAMHAMGEPWSNPLRGDWSQRIKFEQGHSGEENLIIPLLEDAGLWCYGYATEKGKRKQLVVDITTPKGQLVRGHMDLLLAFPSDWGVPGFDGRWFAADIKTISGWGYIGTKAMKAVYSEEESNPKVEHVQQISIYAHSAIADVADNRMLGFGRYVGTKVLDIPLSGTFGGGLVVYFAVDKPKKNGLELPNFHMCHFPVADRTTVDTWLDTFDWIQELAKERKLPPVSKLNDYLWGGNRCCDRWCRRYDVCQREVAPKSGAVQEALNKE